MKIGYARVSTQDQSINMQIDALSEAGCERIYHEKANSTKERPELEICLRTLRKGDTLVVWKLDRLARSMKDLVGIITTIENAEASFVSLTESIDTTTPGGKLVFNIFGSLAEFEHALIRERTMAGLSAARARGRKGGRKPSMTDNDIKKAKAMLLDPEITKKEVASHFKVSRLTLNNSLSRIK
jgi:DNA invertase Pin-like site-specific DNA recombinase